MSFGAFGEQECDHEQGQADVTWNELQYQVCPQQIRGAGADVLCIRPYSGGDIFSGLSLQRTLKYTYFC